MHRFKDLEIWKRSRTFCSEIYSTTEKFPENEKLEILTAQLEEIIKMISKFKSTLKI